MSRKSTGLSTPEQPSKKLLLVAYHFPPVQGSSGVHRTLSFAKFLRNHRWEPTILTVHPRAYPNIDRRNNDLIPEDLKVVRSFALDTQRHLAICGRYPTILSIPDRWQSWIPNCIRVGLKIIREQNPAIVMSTFPIASAHVIGRALHRRSGIPWVADLRDPMIFESFPPAGAVRRSYESLEKSIFEEAARILVTTPGAAAMYRKRYPAQAGEKLKVVENGVDDEIFEELNISATRENRQEKLRLVHSGVVYPEARDPRSFLLALSALKSDGTVTAAELEVIFRASGHDDFITGEVERWGLEDIVSVLPPVPYRDALLEMLSADALLLLQARNCNNQIPAKAYEYLYCRNPILALTDPNGDTGILLRDFGVRALCALEDGAEVERTLREFLQNVRGGCERLPDGNRLDSLSRRARTGELAEVLDEIYEA